MFLISIFQLFNYQLVSSLWLRKPQNRLNSDFLNVIGNFLPAGGAFPYTFELNIACKPFVFCVNSRRLEAPNSQDGMCCLTEAGYLTISDPYWWITCLSYKCAPSAFFVRVHSVTCWSAVWQMFECTPAICWRCLVIEFTMFWIDWLFWCFGKATYKTWWKFCLRQKGSLL